MCPVLQRDHRQLPDGGQLSGKNLGAADKKAQQVVPEKVEPSYPEESRPPYVNGAQEEALERNQNEVCEVFYVTVEQLEEFGWKAFGSNKDAYVKEFNRILIKYDITSKASITMFMATMAHESNFGIDNIEGMRNGKETLTEDNWADYLETSGASSRLEFGDRGAGYIQLTGYDIQKLFLEEMGVYEDMLNSGQDKVHYIADNYSLEAAAWYWGTTNAKKTGVGSLNEYAETYGNAENIFLITQYFVNGYTASDEDLAAIRNGENYIIEGNELIVNGNRNPLPINWSDRSAKYGKAYEIFGP